MRSGSVLVKRSHFITDFNSMRIGTNCSQIISRFEKLTAYIQIYKSNQKIN